MAQQIDIIKSLSYKTGDNQDWQTPIPFGSEAKYISLSNYQLFDQVCDNVQSALDILKGKLNSTDEIQSWQVASPKKVIGQNGSVTGSSVVYTSSDAAAEITDPTTAWSVDTDGRILLNAPNGLYYNNGRIDVTSVFDLAKTGLKPLWAHSENIAAANSNYQTKVQYNNYEQGARTTIGKYTVISNPLYFKRDQRITIFISMEGETNATAPSLDKNQFPGYYLTRKKNDTEYYTFDKTNGDTIANFVKNTSNIVNTTKVEYHQMRGNTNAFGEVEAGNNFGLTQKGTVNIGGGPSATWTTKDWRQLIKYEIVDVKAGQTLFLQAYGNRKTDAATDSVKMRTIILTFYDPTAAELVEI